MTADNRSGFTKTQQECIYGAVLVNLNSKGMVLRRQTYSDLFGAMNQAWSMRPAPHTSYVLSQGALAIFRHGKLILRHYA
jgi:hypothetical protein